MKHLFFSACVGSVFFAAGCGGGVQEPADGSTADAPSIDGGGRDAGGGTCTTSAECDDGLFCNGAETCVAGHCTPGTELCDDHVGCTVDVCSESTRSCTFHAPDLDGDHHGAASCVDATGVPLGDDCDDDDGTRFPGNTETCDATHDEDCNPMTRGGTDEDSDGFESRACCNPDASGALRCGTDCDDGIAATHPGGTEVCDGVDQDCDMVVDDIVHGTVFCQSGQTEACTTACGLSGMRSCGADCLTWNACTAAEVCNGCDDDHDGAADDGFACVAGALSACTTSCGTTGTSTCGADCTVGACRAPEVCNFCDDDGVNGIADEFPLATASDIVRTLEADASSSITTHVAGVAATTAFSTGGGGADYVVQLLDGAHATEVGAYWVDLDRFQGWGPTTINARLQVRSLDGGFPMGGWAVVIATGGSGDVGTPENNGVPDTRTGAHFDWFWGYPFMGFPSNGDRMAYGTWPLPSWRGDAFRPASVIQFGLPIAGPQFDTGVTSYITQEFSIVYQPENPATAPREERVDIRFPTTTTCTGSCGLGQTCVAGFCNDVQTYVPDAIGSTIDPSDDVPVGSRLSIGVTAGSYVMSFFASGATRTASALVDARLYLHHFEPPPAGSGLPPRDTSFSTVTRAGICPGF